MSTPVDENPAAGDKRAAALELGPRKKSCVSFDFVSALSEFDVETGEHLTHWCPQVVTSVELFLPCVILLLC